MQPDHTATDMAQTPPLLSASLDDSVDSSTHRRIGGFARVTFCFAWLFGLEAFLSGAGGDSPASGEHRY